MDTQPPTHPSSPQPDPLGYTNTTQPQPNAAHAAPASPQTPDQNRELYRVHAIWFANLPPPGDELVIQEKTVHLIHKDLFLAKRVKSLAVKDITHVTYAEIPMLATLDITAADPADSLKIRGVPTEQALKAKHVLEGLLLEKAGEVTVPEELQADVRREQLAKQAATPLEAPPTEETQP